jgi:magnesium transporter
MLSSTLWRAFTTPVTYVLLAILLGTAVMQVRYVNKALQRFDSTQVIPIQFVMFTLSVIIGSAVLYRDFERTNAQQAIKFIGGCLLTFFAVFLITSGRPRQEDDDDCLSDEEGIEETIGLSDQEANTGEGAKPGDERRQSVTRSSRRSSRVSFAARPPTVQHDSGVPSPRKPDAAGARAPVTLKGTPTEASPLLTGPWDNQSHPGLPSAFSDESVVTIHSMTSTNTDPLPVDTTLPPHIVAPPSPSGRPRTPRPSFSSSRPHSHHLSNSIISPSPLSSTVSAVVGDGLLRDENGVLIHKRSIRRLRPGFRSSLFVPYSDTEEIQEGDPLVRPTDEEISAAEGESSNQGNGSFRTRARSLSNTLGGLLGRSRHRRNTNPEAGLSRSYESTGESERVDTA